MSPADRRQSLVGRSLSAHKPGIRAHGPRRPGRESRLERFLECNWLGREELCRERRQIHLFPVPVLMKNQHAKPFFRLGGRSKHPNLLLQERPVQPLIPDGTETVESQACGSLPQEDRHHANVIDIGRLAKVIHQSGSREDIER